MTEIRTLCISSITIELNKLLSIYYHNIHNIQTIIFLPFQYNLYKENTACAEPLAKAEADVALILLLGKLYFPLGRKTEAFR